MSSTTSSWGVILLLGSLFCLGTWPALIRLCSTDPSSIRGAGVACFKPQQRHPCHVYIDYSISYFAFSLILFGMLSVTGKQASSSVSSSSFSLPLVLMALLGGSLLSCGNLSMQWSTVVYGAPLTIVLALQASLTVVLGTTINYALQPSRTQYAGRLLAGIVAFLLAIAFATMAHVQTQEMKANDDVAYEECCRGATESTRTGGEEVESQGILAHRQASCQPHPVPPIDHLRRVSMIEQQPSAQSKPQTGLYVAIVGGFCFGFFSPAFNIAVNDPFHWAKGSSGLSVAQANLLFSLSFCIFSLLGNVAIITSTRFSDELLVFSEELSTTTGYFSMESFHKRKLAFAVGSVCALGNVLQFQGGKLAGFAAADLVQAYPLVGTLWDVYLFGEFQRAGSRVFAILLCMYVAYTTGIVCMATSIARN